MATTKQDMDLTTGLSVLRDTDSDATSEANVNSGPATLYLVSADNTANASAKSYLKLWDATAPTVGTTAPDMIIPLPGGATVTLAIPEGLAFLVGLSFATLTAGGTGGITGPTSDVSVVLVFS